MRDQMSHQGLNNIIYMDNAAGTPADPRVVESMLPFFSSNFGNPSAIHPMGQRASDAIEEARQRVADLIGCQVDEIIFTSGGTEADNLAIFGVTAGNVSKGSHIITSEIEHHAVLEICHYLERKGYQITYLRVDSFGMVSPESVKAALRPDTVLVSIMAANNVIGTLQPVSEIGAICQDAGVFFHTDAVQLVGHLPMDVEESGIDLLSISAHKFNGPKGIGALYTRRAVALAPIIFGGGQEGGLRSGTENVPGIVGMGMAAKIARSEMTAESLRIEKMSRNLIEGILGCIPGTRLNGHLERRLPGIVNVSIAGAEGEYLADQLAKRGICVSTGSACSSATLEAPYVLLAIGLERDLANCSIRLSPGRYTDDGEVKRTLETIREIVDHIREQASGW